MARHLMSVSLFLCAVLDSLVLRILLFIEFDQRLTLLNRRQFFKIRTIGESRATV